MLLLMFAAVSPAVAVPPVENSGSWVNDGFLFTCEKQGFDASFDRAEGQFSEKGYFDQNGALVMVRGHKFGVDTLHRAGDECQAYPSPSAAATSAGSPTPSTASR